MKNISAHYIHLSPFVKKIKSQSKMGSLSLVDALHITENNFSLVK